MTDSAFHPITTKVLSGAAPAPLLDAVARGVVPIPPHEILLLRVHLAQNGSSAMSSLCRQELAKQPVDELLALVELSSCRVEVLDYLVCERQTEVALMETAVRHRAISDAAFSALAGVEQSQVLERLLENQERLLALPHLLEVLEKNPAVTGPARAKLDDYRQELARRARRQKGRQVSPEQPPPSGHRLPTDQAPGDESQGALEGLEESVALQVTGTAAAPEADLQEEPLPDESHKEAFQRIMQLSVPDRLQLALKGNREERIILIRDKVKMVSLAVLKSPRLTEAEVENVASMRSVVDEVIQFIAANREWTKSYGVVLALCRNPKTPIRKVLTLMTRLNTRDLKLLITNRGVPEVVRTSARRFHLARTQPKKMRLGRH